MVLSHLIYGLIAITLGIIALKFNYQLVGITGRQEWIENKLGSGSTYFAYKIAAVLLVLGGILAVTGLWDPFMRWALGPLQGLFPGAPSEN